MNPLSQIFLVIYVLTWNCRQSLHIGGVGGDIIEDVDEHEEDGDKERHPAGNNLRGDEETHPGHWQEDEDDCELISDCFLPRTKRPDGR